jgi:glycosyltransferase involved in cell wall biosynthesis
MHVLFVPSYYPSKHAPITGIFFHDQATALHRANHQVGVLATPRLNETHHYLRDHGLHQLRAMNRDPYFPDFPVYRMHWGWFPRVFPPLVAQLTRSAGLRAFDEYCALHGKPDIIHGHNIFYGGYLAVEIGSKHGIPVVVTEYSSSYLEGLIIFPGQPAIIRHTLAKAAVRLVCGRSLVTALHRYSPDAAIDAIGCVVDTEFFTPTSTDVGTGTPFTFVVIAQLKERRKGFDILLKSFAQAFKGRSDVILKIRGHGPLQPELEQLTSELQITPQVEFLPSMTRLQLRELLQNSHSLLSSSYVETFGVSVAEALSCGKPVVSTISGGPEDFVTPRSGILVQPGDINAFAHAMNQMVNNYADYDPLQVRADCVERYSESQYVVRLEQYYRQALAAI